MARAPPTAFDSHPAAWAGRLCRQVETSSTATGSCVTASRTATPAQTHSCKADAPVLRSADQDRPRRLERRAHAVRARRPLRPAGPRRHVAVARASERLGVALDRQDPARAVRDGDDAADVRDLARDRRRGAAELGKDDLVLERVLVRMLLLRRGGRCHGQARVDVVLLPAAVPGRGHLGPDAPTRSSPARNRSRATVTALVALRVAHAMAPCGLAHMRNLRSTDDFSRKPGWAHFTPASDVREAGCPSKREANPN